jgi:hypothetical protein
VLYICPSPSPKPARSWVLMCALLSSTSRSRQHFDHYFFATSPMDSLPLELVVEIAHQLARLEGRPEREFDLLGLEPKSKSLFASYATICRKWKEAIERVNFARLAVKSNDLHVFQTIVTGRRRAYVTELSFTVSITHGPDNMGLRLISEEEMLATDERFKNALCELFLILKAWEDEGVRKPMHLILPLKYDRRWDRLRVMDSMKNFNIDFSIIALQEHRALPRLSNVKHLIVEGGYERRYDPTMATTIAAALPYLTEIQLLVDDVSIEDTAWRVRSRISLAEAIQDVRLQPRATADITWAQYIFDDQRGNRENLVPSHMYYDPLSTSMRIFSQNLSSLSLCGACLDSTIFWPSLHESNAVIPQWPFLKHLYVNFTMPSPSGNWYFTGPDHDEDNDAYDNADFYWDHYRQDPDPVTFTPFIDAFAKAVQKMPMLEYFNLTSSIEDNEETGKFNIRYHAPGRRDAALYDGDEGDALDGGDEGNIMVRRVTYELMDTALWKPSHEVRETLKNVGRDRFGGQVIETFLVGIVGERVSRVKTSNRTWSTRVSHAQ